jgi:glyoxylase-like metal-dependent hydrolase (beta-lactamase superfamily II)
MIPRPLPLTYIVFDPDTKDAVIIDPVLDYDPAASKVSTESFEKNKEFIDQNGLKLHYILETHAHADHLSSSQYIKDAYPRQKLALAKISKPFRKFSKGCLIIQA